MLDATLGLRMQLFTLIDDATMKTFISFCAPTWLPACMPLSVWAFTMIALFSRLALCVARLMMRLAEIHLIIPASRAYSVNFIIHNDAFVARAPLFIGFAGWAQRRPYRAGRHPALLATCWRDSSGIRNCFRADMRDAAVDERAAWMQMMTISRAICCSPPPRGRFCRATCRIRIVCLLCLHWWLADFHGLRVSWHERFPLQRLVLAFRLKKYANDIFPAQATMLASAR